MPKHIAHQSIGKMRYIVYDLECTCWQTKELDKERETIEIGAVLLNEYGEMESDFCQFIRPILHPVLSDFCRRLTSISQIDVNRSFTFPAVIKDFIDWGELYDDEDFLLCSWGGFDKRQLIADCQLHKIETEWLEKHINLKEQYHKHKRLRTPIGLKKVVEQEGFEFTGIHHRGISDAQNLAKIFVKHLDVWQF